MTVYTIPPGAPSERIDHGVWLDPVERALLDHCAWEESERQESWERFLEWRKELDMYAASLGAFKVRYIHGA